MSIRGYGTNMQNWNKVQRCLVIAPPGYKIWQIDQAGAEALVVAYLCSNQRFRMLFLNNIKPHVFVAMHIAPKVWATKLDVLDIDDYLHCDIDKLKHMPRWKELEKYIKDSDNESDPKKRLYYIGKTCCHLLNYDASWGMFQITALKKSDGALSFTDVESKFYRNLYRDILFPEILFYHTDTIHELENNGRVLRNLFGFPRKFNLSWGPELFRQGYAFKPQSTVGCITTMAQTEIQERLDNHDPLLKGVSIWQNGHDSLMGIAPAETIHTQISELRKHLERDLKSPRGEPFKMKSGVGIGSNWGVYHEKKNPLGIQEL